jgi:hypothetical protein
MTRAEEASFVRGWAITGIAVLAPLGLSAVVFALSTILPLPGMMLVGFVTFAWWSCLVLPYSFVEPSIVSPPTGLFLAVAQWLFVALFVAVVTRRLAFRTSVLATLFAVVGTAVAVVAILRGFGHELRFPVP